MNKTLLALTTVEFESSSYETNQFLSFARTFKKEFKKEIESVNGKNIKFNVGHFYISGFFMVGHLVYYFSISDVRLNPKQMMYRLAKDYTDYRGGINRWVNIEPGMASKMNL